MIPINEDKKLHFIKLDSLEGVQRKNVTNKVAIDFMTLKTI